MQPWGMEVIIVLLLGQNRASVAHPVRFLKWAVAKTWAKPSWFLGKYDVVPE